MWFRVWCWNNAGDDELLNFIEKLWSDIAEFETGEVKNESSNQILAKARQDARMEAYVKLFDRVLDGFEREFRFVCLCGLRFRFHELVEHQKSCEVIRN